MTSLRVRLIVAMLLAIFSILFVWLAGQFLQATRQQTGAWDTSLQLLATQVLYSLPANIAEVPTGAAADAKQSLSNEKFSFQVWLQRERRNVLRSPNAPIQPLKPDFQDGFAQVRIGSERWRVYALTDAASGVQAQLAKRESHLRAELLQWSRGMLAGAALMFAVLACAVCWVIRWSLRPVMGLQAAIVKRQPFDLQPLPIKGLPDEIGPLVESFNGLLRQLDAVMQSERRFIADAAHELRTPLAALLAQAQLVQRTEEPQARRAALAKLVEGAQRSSRLSEQLLDSARLDARNAPLPATQVDFHELVAVIVHEFETVAGQRKQSISLHAEPAVMTGCMDELGILVRNLVDNASRHAGQGARIAISCTGGESNGAPGVCLRVADDGPGVPQEDRGRIFDRFHRASGSRTHGSGIGLSLVAYVAQLHGAKIEVGAGIDGRGFGISVRFAQCEPQRHLNLSPAPQSAVA